MGRVGFTDSIEGTAIMADRELKSGDERFRDGERELPQSLADFWRWGYSDLIDNTTRGVLAEFIVASALGVAHAPRRAWSAYDLRTKDGVRVEVKASGLLQAWPQVRDSRISFSIRNARPWNPETDVVGDNAVRSADVYVFCVHACQDRVSVDPLDVAQWEFLVLSTRALNERAGAQKSIGRATLVRLGAIPARYGGLAQAVRAAAASGPTP